MKKWNQKNKNKYFSDFAKSEKYFFIFFWLHFPKSEIKYFLFLTSFFWSQKNRKKYFSDLAKSENILKIFSRKNWNQNSKFWYAGHTWCAPLFEITSDELQIIFWTIAIKVIMTTIWISSMGVREWDIPDVELRLWERCGILVDIISIVDKCDLEWY